MSELRGDKIYSVISEQILTLVLVLLLHVCVGQARLQLRLQLLDLLLERHVLVDGVVPLLLDQPQLNSGLQLFLLACLRDL